MTEGGQGKQGGSRASDKVANTIRAAYESGDTYSTSRICAELKPNSNEYADRLLHDKVDTALRYYDNGIAIDLCCAAGEHLMALAPRLDFGIGIDFSQRYVKHAEQEAHSRGLPHVRFLLADAKATPLDDESVDLLYSFSSLYAIPDVQSVIAEISRVLKRGKVCVLDMGNRRSLNYLCTRYYTEWSPIFPVPYSQLRRMLIANDLKVIEHRAFQILPLWAGKPRWLAPLLHPYWKHLMSRRVGKRMLDEWVSSLPIIRRFAFRHLIVCRRQ